MNRRSFLKTDLFGAIGMAFLLLLAIVALSWTSFASPSPKPGDPSIDGKDYLISETDFRAILVVSRKRIAGFPSYHVHRVHVITRDRVEVFIDDFAHPEWINPHSLELQRLKTGWHITGQSLERDPIID